MTTISNPQQIIGATAVDQSGDKIGKVGQVYLDDQTGQPTWVAINTGMFGNRESFAPLHSATHNGDQLVLTVDKETVKNAPNIDDDGHLNEQEQQALYDYYASYIGAGGTSGTVGHETGGVGTTTNEFADSGEVGGPGHDTSGRNTDDAMTRSEERLHVGTERVEAGRARLRKYVVTETVTQTVPVSHEEVRIEREPITEANAGAALDGPAISEEEHEVTLHAERPVVEKEAVPVERVRLGTETVTDEHTVEEQVRQERIDVDGDGTGGVAGTR